MQNVGKKKSILKNDKIDIDELDFSLWKKIPEDSNIYVNEEGDFINIETKNILRGSERNGYKRIYIKGKHYSAHKLVWETFNGDIPDDMVIDHIDGNRSNNNLSNLRLVSQSVNIDNAQKNGHKGQVKISQYDNKGNFIATYNSIREAAQAVNGSESAIRQSAERYGLSAGYFWIRSDQDITIEKLIKISPSNKKKKTSIGVSQYDIQGNLIKHYDSLKEAAREMGCADSTIKRAADAQRLGKNYFWILDSQNIKISDLINN